MATPIFPEAQLTPVYQVYEAIKSDRVVATIDRRTQDLQNEDNTEIVVTLEYGDESFPVAFFVNLSDQELIRRAELIRLYQTNPNV